MMPVIIGSIYPPAKRITQISITTMYKSSCAGTNSDAVTQMHAEKMQDGKIAGAS